MVDIHLINSSLLHFSLSSVWYILDEHPQFVFIQYRETFLPWIWFILHQYFRQYITLQLLKRVVICNSFISKQNYKNSSFWGAKVP